MPLLAALVSFVIAALLAMGLNWMIFSRWRVMESMHWTERARKLFPIRSSAALNIWLIPALCALSLVAIFTKDLETSILIPAVVSAWVGAMIGTYPLDKKIYPQFPFTKWLRYVFSAWLLRFGAFGFPIAIGVSMPRRLGWMSLILGCAAFGFQISLSFGLLLWLMRIVKLIVRAGDSEPIVTIARQTAERLKVSCRAVWILRSPVGYAAAFPATHEVIFSEGMLASHPDEEIAAICAHEFAHLSESRSNLVARVAGSLGFLPFIFARPMFHLFDFPGVAMLYLPGALLGVFLRRFNRRMEVRADSIAGANESASGVYARALERIYRNNQMPAVMRGNRLTHPHLYDRLLSAGVTPDYPRPKAPKAVSWSTGLMILLLVILFTAILSQQ